MRDAALSRSNQLEQPPIITLPPTGMYSSHEAWYFSPYPMHPRIWKQEHLDSSNHVTFFFAAESNLYASYQIKVLASLISVGFFNTTQLFSEFSSHGVCGKVLTFTIKHSFLRSLDFFNDYIYSLNKIVNKVITQF